MTMADPEFVIEVGRLGHERTTKTAPNDRRLGIVANLRIAVRGRDWFNQPSFPVVELAAAVRSWLSRGGDFEFDTMEAEESPFLYVRHEDLGYSIGAAWQLFEVKDPLPLHAVRGAFDKFSLRVAVASKEQVGVEVDDLIYGGADLKSRSDHRAG
jgi:hypothetical protein